MAATPLALFTEGQAIPQPRLLSGMVVIEVQTARPNNGSVAQEWQRLLRAR